MRVVTTREASVLTGLSAGKLREWTIRRALVPADIPPRRQGSSAKFSWQTILLLRIAAALRDDFHLGLQACRPVFASLHAALRDTSFVTLRGKSLALRAGNRWTWIDDGPGGYFAGDAILIRLAPHLDILSRSFAPPRPSHPTGRPEIFPVPAIADQTPAAPVSHPPTLTARPADKRRRSA